MGFVLTHPPPTSRNIVPRYGFRNETSRKKDTKSAAGGEGAGADMGRVRGKSSEGYGFGDDGADVPEQPEIDPK